MRQVRREGAAEVCRVLPLRSTVIGTVAVLVFCPRDLQRMSEVGILKAVKVADNVAGLKAGLSAGETQA